MMTAIEANASPFQYSTLRIGNGRRRAGHLSKHTSLRFVKADKALKEKIAEVVNESFERSELCLRMMPLIDMKKRTP
jgi:hypothetical protein